MEQTRSVAACRLFIALQIPEHVKREIAGIQQKLRAVLPEECLRLTRPEQFHLTLRFLGNVEARRIDELKSAVATACGKFEPLKLRAERVGCFPDLRFPRVVWAWVHDAGGQLEKLQNAVDRSASLFAENPDDKKFTGHVTIARLNGIKRAEAGKLTAYAHDMSDEFFGEWTAGEVEIVRSELLSSGSHYTTLAVIPLAGASAN